MHTDLIQISWIVFLSISAQWLGWKLKIPAIVFFLIFGFLAGPIFNIVNPDHLFGDLLPALITISVGIILFEGSLTLNFKEIGDSRYAIRHIVLIGAPVAWGLTALSAYYVAGLSWPVAITFGALLIVTGPTVIIPLLKNAKLKASTGSILKWEGIVNDPIGAIIAVLSYEYFKSLANEKTEVFEFAFSTFIELAFISLASFLFGMVLARILNRGFLPEYLKAPFLLSFVVVFYVLCNEILHESGLVGVTILGITLANLGVSSIDDIKKFKESISIMVISSLFIILTARMDLNILLNISFKEIGFVLCLLLIVRPATILASSIGTKMSWKEVFFISWIAPRGIVCAAVAGVLGPQLVAVGYQDAEQILPLAFLIVVVTVFLHGLSAKPFARFLKLSYPDQGSLMIVGSTPWLTQLAETLLKREINVLIVANNWNVLKQARLLNIPTYYGEVLSSETEHNLEFNQYNTILSATNNTAYNALVSSKYAHEFGRDHTYQVCPHNEDSQERKKIQDNLLGHYFGGEKISYRDYDDLYAKGWRFTATRIDLDFNLEKISKSEDDGELITIGYIRNKGKNLVLDIESTQKLKEEDILIYFAFDEDAEAMA